jgi:diaminopimelate epimerase
MATIEFTKLHGTANDFVYVDARAGLPGDPAVLAPRVCDRHRGIGADGLILLLPSETADCRMKIFNADGSTAEMCGNGIRGFAKFVLDRGLARANPLRVETDAGVKTLVAEVVGGSVRRVAVDMGTPGMVGRRIPVDADGGCRAAARGRGRRWNVTCVSMGNPHCVVLRRRRGGSTPAIGPGFERHPFFPQRVNTGFVRVDSPTHLTMRVWERGSGETMACTALARAWPRRSRARRWRCTVALPWRPRDRMAGGRPRR